MSIKTSHAEGVRQKETTKGVSGSAHFTSWGKVTTTEYKWGAMADYNPGVCVVSPLFHHLEQPPEVTEALNSNPGYNCCCCR